MPVTARITTLSGLLEGFRGRAKIAHQQIIARNMRKHD
jgi:hypothetical protein